MDSDTVWAHIDSQRAAVCELLAGLDDAQWRQRSLCDGWTVRAVAAHLTFAQSGLGELFLPLVRAGFRSNTMIRQTAVASDLTHEEIISRLRSFIGSRRHASVVSEKEPLIDLLVHTQDIAVPLGLDVTAPIDAATVAIDRVLQLNRRPVMRLRPPLHGVRLVATDTSWSHGQGAVLQGPIQWLLMHAAGRESAAATHLRVSEAPEPTPPKEIS